MHLSQESFGFNWPGKSAAFQAAEAAAAGRLVDWPGETAREAAHTFISGDNLEALKLLLPEYEGAVSCIFIDPPYNTGSDRFVYRDDFGKPGDRHSAWLSMMLPRLLLARRMLRDDGVIFISIGDDEVHHLALLLNEVFGEQHFVANLVWRRRKTQANLSRLISPVHDYILCYAKDKAKLRFNKIGYSEAFIRKTFSNPDNDPRGPYQTRPLAQPANSTNKAYPLTMPDGRRLTAKWSCAPQTFERYKSENRLYMPKDGAGMPRLRIFLSELDGAIPNTWLDDVATNEEASRELEELFGTNALFIAPKPTALIRHLLGIATGPDDLVLDFFAGSGTTAHAVAEMNASDGGGRRTISVQIPEPVPPASEAAIQGFPTVAHICRERILRVLTRINAARQERGEAIVHLRSAAVQAR